MTIAAALVDIADRPEVPAQLRLVPHAFREVYGRPAEGVWYSPGVVGLLPGVSVCARWGAIVAGSRRDDGTILIGSLNRPAEPVVLPLSALASAEVAPWALPVLRVVEHLAPGGADLFCSVDLPDGSGLSAATALACAAGLALRDLWRPTLPDADLVASVAHHFSPALVEAVFAGYTVGADLSGTGLLVIDTRIRRDTPLRAADVPVSVEGVDGLCRGLTAYHQAHRAEREQDVVVGAALDAAALGASLLVDEPGRPVAVIADPARLGTIRERIADACRRASIRAPRQLIINPVSGAHRVYP